MFAMAQAWVLMFFGLLVFFPSYNLVADWKVESYGGDAYNINPLHPIIVEVCGMTKISLPFHYWWCLFPFFLQVNPLKYVFQNVLNINENECLMFWVFCLVQIEGFWQCIFSPYPWFTKSKHGCVVSYKLGNIMFDDAPFCFHTPCKSWSTTNKTQIVEVILHPIPKCCRILFIIDHQVLWYGEMSNTTTTLHLQHFFFPFLAFNCECARSSIVANASTMLNDAILHAMMSKMCSSRTPQFISNVELGKKIFYRDTMIFSLHVQWWGAILAIFLCHHIFFVIVGVLNVPHWSCFWQSSQTRQTYYQLEKKWT